MVASGRDAWLARYDGAGNEAWRIPALGRAARNERGRLGPGRGIRRRRRRVPGRHDRGSLGGANAGLADAWLARHDGAGNLLWIRQLGTSEDDTALALATDGSDGVYVGGESRGDLGAPSAGDADAWLAHLDGAGNVTWIRQLGTSAHDSLAAAAPDGAGGLYVGGPTSGSLAGPKVGLEDGWLARYDAAGSRTWIRQLGTSSRDTVAAVALDHRGGVYVGGETFGGPAGDAWLARYDSSGLRTWIDQIGTGAYDTLAASAPEQAGGVYVGGSTAGNLGGSLQGTTDSWLALYDALSVGYAANYGCGNPVDSLVVVSGRPRIGTTFVLGVDNPVGTQSVGALPFLAFSTAQDPLFPCGTPLLGFGMQPPYVGQLLIGLGPGELLSPIRMGPPWQGPGSPSTFSIVVPSDVGLIGLRMFAQALLLDPQPSATRLGLSYGVELGIGI